MMGGVRCSVKSGRRPRFTREPPATPGLRARVCGSLRLMLNPPTRAGREARA